jgi:hypothetical protein
MSRITRRDIINGIVGTTTAAMLGSGLTATAQPVQGEQKRGHDALSGDAFKKFRHFIRLSAVLTGIDCAQLAPTFASDNPSAPDAVSKGSDPINADKLAYFDLASRHPAYADLLDAFDKAVQSVPLTDVAQLDQIAVQLLKKEGIKELARSIILVWYLGVWYEWPKANSAKPRSTVVSADAYSQGWVWRIAQAHPPGYSNLRFGHWAFEPSAAFSLDNFQLKALST